MDISRKLLQQRIRNRIIENFESFTNPTWTNRLGTDEMIAMWFDFVQENDTFAFFSEPVFTKKEQAYIKEFHYLLMSSYDTIPSTWEHEALQNNNNWTKLVKAANEALDIFMSRGRFSEDEEIS